MRQIGWLFKFKREQILTIFGFREKRKNIEKIGFQKTLD